MKRDVRRFRIPYQNATMRIFVDVGAHYGETLDVALDPGWGFGRIYSLEPARACQKILRGFRDPRLRVVGSGLSDKAQSVTLYGAGLLGASVYADKTQLDERAAETTETIELIRASEWLKGNTTAEDEVFLKLNCEGSEVDVLNDLLHSEAIGRIRAVYVDFDVRKIPSQAHRQAKVEQMLRESGVRYVTPDSLGLAGNDAVERWLSDVCPRVPSGALSGLRHRLGLYRPPYLVARSVASTALPKPLLAKVVRRFGRQARRR